MRVKKLAVSVISTLITLILLEFFLKLVWLPPELDERYQRRDTFWMENNVVFNTFGYRDKEYSEAKSGNPFRIYILGDSYTFGWYINDYHKLYPELMEESLSEKLERKVEVINAAEPGFSLKEEVMRFKTEGVFLLPDLVMIGLNQGDFNISGNFYKPYKIPITAFYQSRLYQLTLNNLFQKAASSKQYKNSVDIFTNSLSADWQEFEKVMLSLKKEASRINASLAIVLFPHIDPQRPYQKYNFHFMHEKLSEFCREKEIFLIDPLSLYLEYEKKEELVLNPIDPHPSELAHRLVVRSIFDQFDFNQYLARHRPYFSKIRKTRVYSNNENLGPYLRIRKIDSTSRASPWIYFETKYEGGVQEFTLRNLKERQSSVHVDRLETARTFTHEGIIGGSLEYHVLAEDQKSGEIVIADTLYNYPVVGIEAIHGFYEESTLLEYIEPLNFEKLNGLIKITFQPEHLYEVFRLHLAVAAKQLDINADGSIENVVKTTLLRKTIEKDGVNVIKFSIGKDVSGLPLFTAGHQLAYYYAFVNNFFTPLKEVSAIDGNVKLIFKDKLKAGDKVMMPIFASYDIQGKEVLTVELE